MNAMIFSLLVSTQCLSPHPISFHETEVTVEGNLYKIIFDGRSMNMKPPDSKKEKWKSVGCFYNLLIFLVVILSTGFYVMGAYKTLLVFLIAGNILAYWWHRRVNARD